MNPDVGALHLEKIKKGETHHQHILFFRACVFHGRNLSKPCLPFSLRPGGWWSGFWRRRHWAGLLKGSVRTGGPYFCHPAKTDMNFVLSTVMTIGQRGPGLYLDMLCLPWFLLLLGVSLRFIIALQPAAVSLQLGPHFGGTEDGRFVPLWDTNVCMEHSHTSHLRS